MPTSATRSRNPDGLVSQMPGRQQVGGESFTYDHAPYDGGQHWFSAEHDGDEVGHAYVIERQGPGGPHVEIKELWTNPHYRGRGIGSRLLDNVSEHCKGRELRLKPYPIDEGGGQDEGDLREFYSNRGFGDYQLREGDPFELYDYMTKRASSVQASARWLAIADFPRPVQARSPLEQAHEGCSQRPTSRGRARSSASAAQQGRPRSPHDLADHLADSSEPAAFWKVAWQVRAAKGCGDYGAAAQAWVRARDLLDVSHPLRAGLDGLITSRRTADGTGQQVTWDGRLLTADFVGVAPAPATGDAAADGSRSHAAGRAGGTEFPSAPAGRRATGPGRRATDTGIASRPGRATRASAPNGRQGT